jgi:hypothetical protein
METPAFRLPAKLHDPIRLLLQQPRADMPQMEQIKASPGRQQKAPAWAGAVSHTGRS